MPYISIKVSAQPSPALTRTLADGVVARTARILRKKPEVTAVSVDYVSPEHWIVGGRSLAEQGRASVWLDIKVTEGTNTKDEKASYLAEIFAFMGEVLGPLHEESYAYVDEVKGDAYGYGGRTQEHRYIAATLS